jgi:hypothetical protein
MKGIAKCFFENDSIDNIFFNDVVLTFISDDRIAIIASNENPDDPAELLTLECAQISILTDSHLELEGFAPAEVDGLAFFKCQVQFYPEFQSDKEAA